MNKKLKLHLFALPIHLGELQDAINIMLNAWPVEESPEAREFFSDLESTLEEAVGKAEELTK